MDEFTDKTDEELMLLYKNDDLRAFEELYKRFSRSLYGYLKKSCSSYQDVDELFQATVSKLDRYKGNFKERYSFKSWLFTICKNVKRDHYSKERNYSLFKDKLEDEVTLEVNFLINEEGSIEDYDHFNELNSNEKKILILKFNEDKSYDEISDFLGIKPPSIRKTVSRAIKKLRLMAQEEL